jgi:nucleotide-binding universal stress UspA family protein
MREQGPILVPLDGSELAESAIPYASALAEALRTHLVLLTVWEGTETELAAALPSVSIEIEQSAQSYYTTYLDGIRQRFGRADQTRTIVRPGDAGEEILKAIDETHARLVVVATHGRSGIGRWMYGSTAGRVIKHSPVPVLAVGPHTLQRSTQQVALKHIAVTLDGSAVSEQAIPVASVVGAALGAKVSLLRGVNWAVQSYPYSLPDAYIPQIDEELEKGAKAYLRTQEEALKGKFEVDAFVLRGAIADGILDFVEKHDIDLVVMTTHARTGLLRSALGSTADRVIQGKAPVLLVPPEAQPAKR